MIINIKNNDIKDDSALNLTEKEFWKLFLQLRNPNKLTNKEIDVLSDHLVGEPKALKGNYKTYVERLEEKKISLQPKKAPKVATLQIKINVT